MKKAPQPVQPGASPAVPVRSGKTPPQARARPSKKTSPLARALGRPFRFVGGLFTREVRLERDGKNLNIKLGAKAGAPPQTAKPPAPPSPAELELQQMRAELKKLLDLHPGTRRVMRHLVYFERALATQGLQAVIDVPEEVLSTALEQLEALVSNWSNRDLATLRSKMSVAAVNRARDPFYGANGHKASAFHTESRLHVGEASHSMFLELERQYQAVLPRDTVQSVMAGLTPPASPAAAAPVEDKSVPLNFQ
jgi:hypothetical protein